MTRVLVADDSDTIRLLLRKRLELAGFEVEAVADGHAAVEAQRNTPADVIVLDAMMPRMSGLDALRAMRDAGDQTPVMMVSAHRDSTELREAISVGASETLTKPIDWDELLGAVRRLAGA